MKRHIVSALERLAFMNLVLAFSTAFASSIVLVVLGLPLMYEPLFIIFLVTFAGYTFNRFTDKEDGISHPKRTDYIKGHGHVLFLVAAISYGTAILLSGMANVQALFMTLLPGIAILLYSLEWIPTRKTNLSRVQKISRIGMIRRIKEIHVMKNVFVAFIWSITVVFLPLSYLKDGLSVPEYGVLFMWVFFFGRFLVNTVVFDLKDIDGDRRHNIRSLPVTLGYERTRDIMVWVNAAVFLLTTAVIFLGYLPGVMHIPNVFSAVYAYLYLRYLRNKVNVHFMCDVFVDGEYIIMALPLYLYINLIG
ncbi:MAG: UbiA family prenyltransferase [Candidatus Altiarchaeota archaeon]|nr:UbiA family prenyltransferase [Candidatus Altiarchaeota archaeon]